VAISHLFYPLLLVLTPLSLVPLLHHDTIQIVWKISEIFVSSPYRPRPNLLLPTHAGNTGMITPTENAQVLDSMTWNVNAASPLKPKSVRMPFNRWTAKTNILNLIEHPVMWTSTMKSRAVSRLVKALFYWWTHRRCRRRRLSPCLSCHPMPVWKSFRLSIRLTCRTPWLMNAASSCRIRWNTGEISTVGFRQRRLRRQRFIRGDCDPCAAAQRQHRRASEMS